MHGPGVNASLAAADPTRLECRAANKTSTLAVPCFALAAPSCNIARNWHNGCAEGRPLPDGRVADLHWVSASNGSVLRPFAAQVREAAPPRIPLLRAATWAQRGAAEHASVVSFALRESGGPRPATRSTKRSPVGRNTHSLSLATTRAHAPPPSPVQSKSSKCSPSRQSQENHSLTTAKK